MNTEKKKTIASACFVLAELAWLVTTGATVEDVAVFVTLLAAKLAADHYLSS